MNVKSLGGLLAVACFCALGFANGSNITLNKKFQLQKGCTILLPDNWIPIPKEILDQFTENLRKNMPKLKKQVYDFGFQPAANKNWLEPPYIMIQVKNGATIPEKDLKNMPKLEKVFQRDIDEAADKASQIVQKVSAGQLVYDKQNHIIFFILSLSTVGGQNRKGLGAIVLMQTGVLDIYSFANEEDFSRYVPLYQVIAKSVHLDDNLVYRGGPKPSPFTFFGINWLEALLWGIAGGFVSIIFSFVSSFFKKKTEENI